MTNGLSLEELMKEGTYPEEYAEGENWKILHGDTLKLVKAFQPGIFDAVITDPPYASGGTKQNERNRTTNQKYSSMSAANALPDFDGDNKDHRIVICDDPDSVWQNVQNLYVYGNRPDSDFLVCRRTHAVYWKELYPFLYRRVSGTVSYTHLRAHET